MSWSALVCRVRFFAPERTPKPGKNGPKARPEVVQMSAPKKAPNPPLPKSSKDSPKTGGLGGLSTPRQAPIRAGDRKSYLLKPPRRTKVLRCQPCRESVAATAAADAQGYAFITLFRASTGEAWNEPQLQRRMGA